MRKKMLAALLSLTMLLSLIAPVAATGASTTSGTCGDSAKWNFDMASGVLTISGKGSIADYMLSSSGYAMPPWYDVTECITRVIVSDGITSLGSYAFAYADRLSRVDLPGTLRSLGTKPFHACDRLSDIYFAGDVNDWARVLSNTDDSEPEGVTIHYSSTGSGSGGGTETPVDPDPPTSTKARLTAVGFKDFVLSLTFDTVMAGTAPDLDYTVSRAFTVYRKSTGSAIFTATSSDSKMFSFGGTKYTLAIDLSGIESVLVENETYQIVMGEGFVKFNDKVVSPAIVKGDVEFSTEGTSVGSEASGFSTKATVEIATGVSADNTGDISVSWADSWFERSSSSYSSDVAMAALALSGAASATTGSDGITDALEDFGFSYRDTQSSGYGSSLGRNSLPYTLAIKEIRKGQMPTYLVAIVIRDPMDDDGQYLRYDLAGGSSGEHAGYHSVASNVAKDLRSFMSSKSADYGTTKFLVTGHGCAGSVANIVAHDLSSEATRSNVFGYTFSAPAVSRYAGRSSSDRNIFNIVSVCDFLSKFPLDEWGYGLWGVTLALPNTVSLGVSGYDSMSSRHDTYFRSLTGTTYRAPNGTATMTAVFDGIDSLVGSDSYFDRTTLSTGSGYASMSDFFEDVAAALISDSSISIALRNYGGDFDDLREYIDDLEASGSLRGEHSLANCYAWMASCTASQLWGSSSPYYDSSYRYKTYRVDGPVDLYVYDRYNRVVASVVDGKVKAKDLDVYVDDELKIVDLYNHGTYSLEIKPYSRGTLDCIAYERTMSGVSVVDNRTIRLTGISVESMDTLTCNVPDGTDGSATDYQLLRRGSQDPIVPGYDTSGDRYGTYTIKFDGVKTVTTDSRGRVSSIPTVTRKGYKFDGWYTTDGEYVTTSTRFTRSQTVYAQWIDEDGYVTSDAPDSTRDGYYTVSVPVNTTGGAVTTSHKEAKEDQRVTLTVKEKSDYVLDSLRVVDRRGDTVTLKEGSNGKYTFEMPRGNVTVKVAFTKQSSITTTPGGWTPVTPGTGTGTIWYQNAISYVTSYGLMSGVGNGNFAPNAPLTRAMLAQILYNHAGRPAVSGKSPFSDVPDSAWYAKAIIWARNSKVINGYGQGKFGPNDVVTREQFATILFQYAGRPPFAGEVLTYIDAWKVHDWARLGVEWAVSRKIVNGVSVDILDPRGATTRAQAAQMLMTYLTQ